MSTKTTYIDPRGTMRPGYIVGGKTYKDPEGTTPVDNGSIVFAGGKQYYKSNGVGELWDPNNPDQKTNWGKPKEDATLGSSSSGMGGGYTGNSSPYDIDLQQEIDNLYNARRESQIAGLKSAAESAIGNLTKTYNTGLSDLDTTQSGIGERYYGKRNQAAAQSDIGAMNFAQYMASRGVKGSAGGMPEIYRNNALQGTLGDLDASEAQDNAAIDRQRSLLTSAYNTDIDTVNNQLTSGIAEAGASLDAAALQQKIDMLKAQAEKSAAQTTADKNAWLGTIGRFSNDYQAEINRVQNDGDPSNDWQIPYLQSARQDKINAQNQNDQQRFMDTIGQYAGQYGQQADIIQNDGDPSNDWQIPYLRTAAAEEAAAQAAQKSGGHYSGGGSPSGSTASGQDAGIVDTMLGFGNDTTAYEYLIGLGLAQGKTDMLWNFYTNSGGTSGGTSPFNDATGSDRYDNAGSLFSENEYSLFVNSLPGYRTANGQRAAIQDAYTEGKITEQQAQALLAKLGIAY